ncbi:glycosyl hydrolase-related protein [Deinococcus malanensis]|uniref:glycosyl hydrolase-related protein n=1 Tax=Deinococcus malanensis TaxID=1706855 RepID=UPI00362970C9
MLTERPVVIPETYHDGAFAPAASFMQVEPANAQVTVFKRAEDNHGYVLRLVETHGHPVQAQVNLPGLDRQIQTGLGAFEIKTLLIPDGGGAAQLLNLTELEVLGEA